VAHGEEAISYLAGHGKYANRDAYPLPDLLVLDLKMPLRTGHEVLKWLQTHKSPPVTVVFSASERPDDIARALACGARNYFVKPYDWHEWKRQVIAIAENCPRRRQERDQPRAGIRSKPADPDALC
jgi:CheY-like chemotaxis protein